MDHRGVHQQAPRNHHNLQDGKTVVSCRNRTFAIVERAAASRRSLAPNAGQRRMRPLSSTGLSFPGAAFGNYLYPYGLWPHLNLDNDSLKSYHVVNSMHNGMI